MNRKQRREAKGQLSRRAKHQTGKISDAIDRMPTRCDECQEPFDNRDKTMLDKWRIAVYDDGPIHLVCPDCVPDDITNKSREKKK